MTLSRSVGHPAVRVCSTGVMAAMVLAVSAAGPIADAEAEGCNADPGWPAGALELRLGPADNVTWINHSRQPVAIWTHTDTDAGRHHDALWLVRPGHADALVAPRKHAAPRFCRLAPGEQHTLIICLAAWRQRLPGLEGDDLQLEYRIDGSSGPAIDALLPDCNGRLRAATADAWHGCLRAAR